MGTWEDDSTSLSKAKTHLPVLGRILGDPSPGIVPDARDVKYRHLIGRDTLIDETCAAAAYQRAPRWSPWRPFKGARRRPVDSFEDHRDVTPVSRGSQGRRRGRRDNRDSPLNTSHLITSSSHTSPHVYNYFKPLIQT
jgi:hypothetical protein